MDAPSNFEIADGYARYCPTGPVALPEGIRLIALAIAYARTQGVRCLFIDTTQLTGFETPTMLERFTLSDQAARAAQSLVKVALVAKAELIDAQKFGVTVARNRGLLADVFTTESAALAWLLATDAT